MWNIIIIPLKAVIIHMSVTITIALPGTIAARNGFSIPLSLPLPLLSSLNPII